MSSEQAYDNTHEFARYTSQAEDRLRDGKTGAYGYCFLDDMDTEEFRALPGAAVRCYFVLISLSSKGVDTAWPLQSTIARITGLSARSVKSAITALAEAGFLLKLPGRGRSYSYRLLRAPSRRKEAKFKGRAVAP